LGNYESFLEQYGKNRKKIHQDAYLKKLIQKVMIRNTRKGTELNTTKRTIETIWLNFSKKEKEVYDDLNTITGPLSTFSKITYLREIGSSREDCSLSLQSLDKKENKKELVKPLI